MTNAVLTIITIGMTSGCNLFRVDSNLAQLISSESTSVSVVLDRESSSGARWTPLAALAVLVSNPNGPTQMANVFSVGMYGSGVLLFSLAAFYLFFLLILMLFDQESFEIIRGGNRFRWKEMRQSRVPWIGITLAVVIVSWELRSLVEAVKSTV